MRLVLLIACCVAVMAGCTDGDDPTVTAQQAKASTCRHLRPLRLLRLARGSDSAEAERVIAALEVDTRLLEQTGQDELASSLSRAIAQVRSGMTPPTPMSILLRQDATKVEINEIRRRLEDDPRLKEVEFISKAQQFAEFKKTYASQPEFVESLPPDAFPASFRAETAAGVSPQQVEDDLEGAPGVDKVQRVGELAGAALPLVTLAGERCRGR
jgi:hypothetical protein